MQTRQFKNAPVLSALQVFTRTVQTGSTDDIRAEFETLRALPMFSGPGWRAAFDKLALTLADGKPRFSIFAKRGNVKLPFIAFSTLPGVTCPGAGDCLQFCYSFRAWRYPAAFARQCQNAYLMRFGRDSIGAAFRSIAAARPAGFDFRLYVDGDFAHMGDVGFWMSTLRAAPQCRAYGYSKSFAALLAYPGRWPANYMLNISSGHNSDALTVDAIRALPITRGEFRAVSIGRKVSSSDHGTRETNAALRAAVPDDKIFPCPGKCGTCTGAGHACGMPQLRGRVIAIAIH